MSKIFLLNNVKYEGVENIELFSIEYLPKKIDLSKYDALIFTSKNAIYSIDSFNKQWKDIPSYAIASKTAEIIEKYNGNLIFTGKKSHGDDFAHELIDVLKEKRVLYLKAQKTVSNLTNILKENNIDIDEQVIYKTSCKDVDITLQNNSVFIFTSPSTVECFFNKFTWNDTYKAIAIGKTTAKYFPTEINYKVSSLTSIDECIKLAKEA
jgi:uroporphyrinogen-III synthase